jgi:hypothetical protein
MEDSMKKLVFAAVAVLSLALASSVMVAPANAEVFPAAAGGVQGGSNG